MLSIIKSKTWISQKDFGILISENEIQKQMRKNFINSYDFHLLSSPYIMYCLIPNCSLAIIDIENYNVIGKTNEFPKFVFKKISESFHY